MNRDDVLILKTCCKIILKGCIHVRGRIGDDNRLRLVDYRLFIM